jgi:hypothetical protein
MSGKTLKQMLNTVLGRSAFLQEDAFATGTDVDNIQMVAFANDAASDFQDFYAWNTLRRSTQITLVADQVAYPLPDDFDILFTETMWKSNGARNVVIPTGNEYWSFIKAGNPGTRVNYYAKLIDGMLEFTAVSAGDVINFDYQSAWAITDSDGTPKPEFDNDTDLFLLDDNTLINGIKAYWKTEKEIATAPRDEARFMRDMRRFIVKDTAAKVIRSGARDERYYPYAPPISQDYLW